MPLYEYECQACGHRLEALQKMSDPPLAECPDCEGGTLKRLLSAPAFQFKGTGWYVTDYGGKGAGAAGKEGKSESAGTKESTSSDSTSSTSSSSTDTSSSSSSSSSSSTDTSSSTKKSSGGES